MLKLRTIALTDSKWIALFRQLDRIPDEKDENPICHQCGQSRKSLTRTAGYNITALRDHHEKTPTNRFLHSLYHYFVKYVPLYLYDIV